MRQKRQSMQGVAAVEFALVLLPLVLMLSGLFVYWSLLQTQQSITRATGDGARLLQSLAQGANNQALLAQHVEVVVRRGIQDAGLANSMATEIEVDWADGQATLTVSYPNPIASHLWSGMPMLRHLKAQAVVEL